MDFLNTIINSPVFNSLSITLLHFIWQGSALAMFLGIALKLISNKYSNLRYNLSLFTLVLCLITPVITFFVVYEPHQPNYAPLLINSQLVQNVEFNFTSYLPLLSIIWLVGVCYFSIGYCKALLSIYKLPKTQVSKPESWLLDLFLSIKTSMQVTQNVRLLVSKVVDVPMVIGWLKPVVLVPINMVSGLSNEQLKLLLAHELAHVKRYDYFINLIQSLVEVFLFYHPAVKWISKQIRVDREYCCDDMAVKNNLVKIEYAKALLNAEELRPDSIPTMAMAATGGDLKARVSRVVGEHTCTPKYAKSGLAGLLGLFVVSLIFSSYKVVAMVQSKDSEKLKSSETISLIKEENEQVKINPPAQNKINDKSATKIQIQPKDVLINKVNNDLIFEDKNIKNKALETQKNKKMVKKGVEKLSVKKALIATKKLALKAKAPTHVNYQYEENSPNNSEVPSLKIINKVAAQDIQNQLNISLDEKVEINLPKEDLVKPYEPLVIPPKTLKMVSPIYTEIAQRRGYKGDVVIEFTVDLTGKATDIEFVGDTQSHLKRAVRKAIKKWEFSPGTINGNETIMRETKLFSFVKPNRDKMSITTGTRLVRHN